MTRLKCQQMHHPECASLKHTLGASVLMGTETPCSRTSSGLTAAGAGLAPACGLAEGARCGCNKPCEMNFGSGAAGAAGWADRANSAAPCTPGGGGPVVLQAVHAPSLQDHLTGMTLAMLVLHDTPYTRHLGCCRSGRMQCKSVAAGSRGEGRHARCR